MRKLTRIIFYGFFSLCLLGLVYIGFNYYNNIPIETLSEKYTYDDSKFMDIVGMEVHYRVTGAGEPLVLLHGTASSLHTWEAWTKELSNNYQVISLDLPGFGLTGKHFSNDYSIKAYTDFLDVFLDKLGVEKINLAGNSLGGHIAWQYALDHKNRVKHLILLNASGFPQEREPTLAFRLAEVPLVNKLMLRVTPRSLVEESLEETYYDDDKITDSLVTRFHSMQLRRGNRQAFIDKSNQLYQDRSKELSNLEMPTLILWGKHDEWFPLDWANRYNEAIPNSKVLVFDNAGHVPMEEIPVETARAVHQFLDGDGVVPLVEH